MKPAETVPLPSREAEPSAGAHGSDARKRRRPNQPNVPALIEARRRGDSRGGTPSYRMGTFPAPLHAASDCATPDSQMLGLLSELDDHIFGMARRCRTKADCMGSAEAAKFHALMKKLDDALNTSNAGGSAGSLRSSFIDLGGLSILQRAFAIPLNRSGGARDDPLFASVLAQLRG